ncbi:hypothetical protein ACIQI7_38330 [Kitasatospora sp. NPDC092039]|uniref:hypothetical protein n=1 Tax=Kitasatospora sp. NPDC092039 TaxID=3364086 RepID=UPI0038284B10
MGAAVRADLDGGTGVDALVDEEGDEQTPGTGTADGQDVGRRPDTEQFAVRHGREHLLDTGPIHAAFVADTRQRGETRRAATTGWRPPASDSWRTVEQRTDRRTADGPGRLPGGHADVDGTVRQQPGGGRPASRQRGPGR